VLISADYSQIELRLLAHIGDIPQLKAAFAQGLDIHAMTASQMFGVPVEGMPAETRRRAKAINFGIVYGISAFGLANQLSIPREEAGAYIKTYFERFPGIRTYMDRMQRQVRAEGFVTTIFGRKIFIPAAQGKSPAERAFGDRAAINAPIQGAAADVIRRAMVRMPQAVKLTASGAVFGSVGRAQQLDLANDGCGDWTLADVTGHLHISQAGAGSSRAGRAGSAQLLVAGSGGVSMGDVGGDLAIDMADAGAVRVASAVHLDAGAEAVVGYEVLDAARLPRDGVQAERLPVGHELQKSRRVGRDAARVQRTVGRVKAAVGRVEHLAPI
jgi:hypothetical protein